MVVSCRPRLRLLDRLPEETGSVLLGTGLWWRAASASMNSDGTGPASAPTQVQILANMPAGELFCVIAAAGMDGAEYPFTSAFYENAAYAVYKKRHFCYLILPRTIPMMGDDMGAAAAGQRQMLLGDARFLEVYGEV